ncbi:MAG TPA: oxygenase MpaB family protein [Saprospiraceae bacterium]|nr:oxygenase MpaB family protein [Saprospiraceae bacterium]
MNHSENLADDVTGYFGPGTITWQLYREPVFVLGGVRALLLQIAHPAVADGVARYSGFQSDPFGRGYRTFAAMAMIYFGTKKQAEATAQRLWRIHSGITGKYPLPTPHSLIPYSANDPDLLLWVLATLTETTLQVYSRTPFGNLPPDWKERFYEESKIAARLLGIPDEVYPPDLQAFESYFAAVLNGRLLGSTLVCQEMAQAIVRHPRAPKKWAALFAAGWLPASLCQRLGIEAGDHPEVRLEKWLRRFGRIYRLLPGWLRYNPAYHQAQYRIDKARGKSLSPAGWFFTWLGRRVKVPLGVEV